MNRPAIQTLTCLAATSLLLTTGCHRPTKFSTVLEGGFDPAKEFRKHGYAVQLETRGENIRNAEWGYGWGSWCGVLASTNGPMSCEAVAVVIHDELNRSLSGGSLDELTVGAGRSQGGPLTGMLQYNKDEVHGNMHVWLTPVGSNSVSYVIFLIEEKLN